MDEEALGHATGMVTAWENASQSRIRRQVIYPPAYPPPTTLEAPKEGGTEPTREGGTEPTREGGTVIIIELLSRSI